MLPLIAVVLAVIGVAAAWFFLLREVTVSVNGKDVAVRVNTQLAQFIEDNDNFGAKPGRMLSVGGNVLSADGGSPYTVTLDGEELTSEQIETTKVHDGAKLTVEDGKDAEEPSTKETSEIAPDVQWETGGAIQYVSQWGKTGTRVVKTGKTSGEVAEEVTEKPADMIISSVNPSPEGGRYVALTFDDGPSSYTPEVLEILKEKGVHATFFNLGTSAQSYPDECQAILDGGHELASHTMAHENLPLLGRDALREEITGAADAIEKASGERPQMIRAPYGAFTEVEWARAGDLISCNVLWNIDTRDWELPGADSIRSTAVSQAYNGAIILMHDGGGDRSQTVEALPGIIDDLRAEGYEFVTVAELIELDGRIPEAVANSKVSMPEDAVLPEV